MSKDNMKYTVNGNGFTLKSNMTFIEAYEEVRTASVRAMNGGVDIDSPEAFARATRMAELIMKEGSSAIEAMFPDDPRGRQMRELAEMNL